MPTSILRRTRDEKDSDFGRAGDRYRRRFRHGAGFRRRYEEGRRHEEGHHVEGRDEKGRDEKGRHGKGYNEEGRNEERRNEERRDEEGRNEEISAGSRSGSCIRGSGRAVYSFGLDGLG